MFMNTRPIKRLKPPTRRCIIAAALALVCVASAGAGRGSGRGGGNVLPPSAKPSGYSLADMAEALAYFSTSGNDPQFYPDTPFQVLHISDTNAFTVRPGTRFFVPVLYVDDSPPILGDFPADAEDAAAYVLGEDQLGAQFEIEVDGRVTPLGDEYVAGPVLTPGLKDGGGSHFIQVGAFLTPLPKGTHTVTIRSRFDGDVILDLVGEPLEFEDTYTVVVR